MITWLKRRKYNMKIYVFLFVFCYFCSVFSFTFPLVMTSICLIICADSTGPSTVLIQIIVVISLIPFTVTCDPYLSTAIKLSLRHQSRHRIFGASGSLYPHCKNPYKLNSLVVDPHSVKAGLRQSIPSLSKVLSKFADSVVSLCINC